MLDLKLKIAFAGKMCSGKTTTCYGFADYLDKGTAEQVQILAFSYGIREIAMKYFDYLWKDGEKNRDLFIAVGNAMRDVDSNVWCNDLVKRANQPGWATLVEDVRMPKEYETLLEKGFIFVYLDCDETIRRERHHLLYGSDSRKYDKDKTEALDWENFWSKAENVIRLDTGKGHFTDETFKRILNFYIEKKGHDHLNDRMLDVVLDNLIEEFDKRLA
jgi:dephospho-CoA kinase